MERVPITRTSKGETSLLPRNAASCVFLLGTLQPVDDMRSVIAEISPLLLLSREKGFALLLLCAEVKPRAAAVPTTTAP